MSSLANVPSITSWMYQSPNHSSRKRKKISGIVIHYTAGGDAKGSAKWLCDSRSKASAHYLISRGGSTWCLVPEESSAWHAGSRTTIPALHGQTGVNLFTIGIELANWGLLYQPAEQEKGVIRGTVDIKYVREPFHHYTWFKDWTYRYRGVGPMRSPWKAPGVPLDWPGGETAEWWEPYPQAQFDALVELCTDLMKRYPAITRERVVGHSDVDPQRKMDPGPVFPMTEVLDAVFRTEPKDAIEVYDGGEGGGLRGEVVMVDEMMKRTEPRSEPGQGKKSCWRK